MEIGKIDQLTEKPAVIDATKVAAVSAKKETNQILIVIYLLYNTNMITRLQLVHMLQVIEKPFPENLAEWLLKESKK